jgi:hypothetical protein
MPGTTLHAGYARYLTPPPFELVGNESIAKFANTSAAPTVALDTTPRSEKANYFDIGVEQKFAVASVEGFTARFDVINVFDQVYEIRDGTGVGAPQYGPRRGFFVGLSKAF